MSKACGRWTPATGSMWGMWPKSGQSEPRRRNSRIFVWAFSETDLPPFVFRFESCGSCKKFIITRERLLENGANPGAESRGASRGNRIPLNLWIKATPKPTLLQDFEISQQMSLCFNWFETCLQPAQCPDTEIVNRSALISSNFMAS